MQSFMLNGHRKSLLLFLMTQKKSVETFNIKQDSVSGEWLRQFRVTFILSPALDPNVPTYGLLSFSLLSFLWIQEIHFPKSFLRIFCTVSGFYGTKSLAFYNVQLIDLSDFFYILLLFWQKFYCPCKKDLSARGMLCFLSICGQFAENNELFAPWPFSHPSFFIFLC